VLADEVGEPRDGCCVEHSEAIAEMVPEVDGLLGAGFHKPEEGIAGDRNSLSLRPLGLCGLRALLAAFDTGFGIVDTGFCFVGRIIGFRVEIFRY
jgi:hypothetical protein